jgi:tetrahydromethanopterin S-methyltransferase subunit F
VGGDETQLRRIDDRDREWLTRLDRLEKGQVALESVVALLKQAQGHAEALMDQRLKLIEKSQEFHALKLEEVKTLLTTMATEPDRMPAIRGLVEDMKDCNQLVARHDDALKQLQGALTLMQWLGFPGVLAGIILALVAILRAAKVVP